MFLQKNIHLINFYSHIGDFWMKCPSKVRTEGLSFVILLYSLWTWRLIWLLFLHKRLISLLSSIIRYLTSSCNQCLIFIRSNDPHLDQLVMLLSEIFNEGVKSRNPPIWSSELHWMKVWYKYCVVYTKFRENGKDELMIRIYVGTKWNSRYRFIIIDILQR